MEYLRKLDLQELRKSNKEVELYAVYKHLAHAPFKIQKMSKQYIYWDDDTKHAYPSSSAGYSLFDNELEAWQTYKILYETRKEYIKKQYDDNMKQLNTATIILQQCMEKTPEYFI